MLAHPAVIELARAGGSVVELAGRLDVAQSTASSYLAGTRSAPGRLRDALADLVGADAADRVVALIPNGASSSGHAS